MAKDKYYGEKRMGQGDFANMPQKEMMKSYPKQPYANCGEYKDDMQGIDAFNREMVGKLQKQKKN